MLCTEQNSHRALNNEHRKIDMNMCVCLQIHLRKYDLGLYRARELTEDEKSMLIQASGGQEA